MKSSGFASRFNVQAAMLWSSWASDPAGSEAMPAPGMGTGTWSTIPPVPPAGGPAGSGLAGGAVTVPRPDQPARTVPAAMKSAEARKPRARGRRLRSEIAVTWRLRVSVGSMDGRRREEGRAGARPPTSTLQPCGSMRDAEVREGGEVVRVRAHPVAVHGSGGIAIRAEAGQAVGAEEVERVATGGDDELDVDDVVGERPAVERRGQAEGVRPAVDEDVGDEDAGQEAGLVGRSEERRGGEEGR